MIKVIRCCERPAHELVAHECAICERVICLQVACLHAARLSKTRADSLIDVFKVFFVTAAAIIVAVSKIAESA